MAASTLEILRAVEVLFEALNLNVVPIVVVGVPAFVGAYNYGVYGMLVGAAVGGLTWYFRESAVDYLRHKMTDKQKERFCDHIREAYRKFELKKFLTLYELITTEDSFQAIVIALAKQYFENERGMKFK